MIDIGHTAEADHDFLAPRGELDIATYSGLRTWIDELIDSGRIDIVVDLSETTFLDSTALGALVGGRNRILAAGGALALLCNRPKLLQLFERTRLDGVFDIFESREAWVSATAS